MATTTYTDPSPVGVTTAALDSSAHIHRRILGLRCSAGLFLSSSFRSFSACSVQAWAWGPSIPMRAAHRQQARSESTAGLWWVLSSLHRHRRWRICCRLVRRRSNSLRRRSAWTCNLGYRDTSHFLASDLRYRKRRWRRLFCPRQCGVRFRQWPKRNGETACSGRRRFSRYDPATGAGLSSAY